MPAGDKRKRLARTHPHNLLHLVSRCGQHDERRRFPQRRQTVALVGQELNGIAQDGLGTANASEFPDEGLIQSRQKTSVLPAS